jgi:hypothetical protein
MSEKTKILYITDHSLRTGFGIVAHNVCNGLAEAGYDVYYLGWGFKADTTFRRGNYTLIPTGNGMFGEDIFAGIIQQLKPEVVITQADTRMVMWMPEILSKLPNKPV